MRKIAVLLVFALMLALVPAVLAGGWAVITLDEPPGDIRAGEPWTLDFTVLQHGQTPVHDLGDGVPIEPLLVAENPVDGRRLEIMATPGKEVGHFTVEVTFPTEGEWAWTIFPNPLAGETLFEPLTVLPAVSAAPEKLEAQPAAPAIQPAVAQSAAPAADGGAASLATGLRWAALAVIAAAVALFVIQSRRRAALQARVES
jgi:hypothetical protein